MKGIYETRLSHGDNGPVTTLDRVAEADAHYATAKLTSSDKTANWASSVLSGYFSTRQDCEEFLAVLLDTKHRPKVIVRITRGTLDASLIHPREVFRPAIHVAASSVILIHNHPSGDPTPSREDIEVTDRLIDAGRIVGINVLDHIVLGSYPLSVFQHKHDRGC